MQFSRPARTLILLLPAAGLLYGAIRLAAKPAEKSPDSAIIGKQADGTYFVPTGQTLNPAGKNLSFDGRPIEMALRPDGKMIALMCQRGTRLFDTQTQQFLPDLVPGSHNLGGIVWSRDGHTLYSTGKVAATRRNGAASPPGVVYVTHFDESGKATQTKPIGFELKSRIKPNRSAKDSQPCGLALSPDEKTLYVTLFNNGTLAAVDLSTYDPKTGDATSTEVPVGSSPERVVVSRDGSKLFVANRGGKSPEAGDTMDDDDPVVVDPKTYKAATGTVSVVNTKQMAEEDKAVTKSIPVGLQPTDMIFSPNGNRLFVANANNDSVSVIDPHTDAVVETIATSPAPGGLAASSPNGLAISKDGGTLYVTLGGDNAVAVIALDKEAGGIAPATRIAGLIPTAWFPLGVVLSPEGNSLYIANSKGIGSLGSTVTRLRSDGASTPEAGPGGNLQPDSLTGHSVYSILGSLGVIPVPNKAILAQMTATVSRNNHFDRMAQAIGENNEGLFWQRFKHVVLVIKENRTYDQLFADIPVPAGHVGGDRSLLMFGEKVTPNHHALAHEFGLFDNLYCSGTISADGHHWLNESFADDYAERGMNNYPRSYPCCGTDPLVFAGNKFLWQAAMDRGRTFQNYGEFNPLPSMKLHSDTGYNQKLPVTADRNADVARCERILKDLDSEKPLADLTTIWFSNDHTSGTRAGSYTPESDVADNDLAVGRLIDKISHSKKYWQDEPTVIFIVEDDAQGGLDHVEGHRTVGLVVSPFNKRGQIFSTNFNQLNMIHTIEMILGVPPLNQFDAAAIPMRSVFQEKGDFRPYTFHKNEIALNLINPPLKKLAGEPRHWAAVSAQLDFSAPDRADPEQLTEVLWHHTHGSEAYPPPTASR